MHKRYTNWLPLACPPTGGLARNPGMCPDQKSNWQLFGSQASAQSSKPHQPGLDFYLSFSFYFLSVYLKGFLLLQVNMPIPIPCLSFLSLHS